MQKLLMVILALGWGCSESDFTSSSAQRTVKNKTERQQNNDEEVTPNDAKKNDGKNIDGNDRDDAGKNGTSKKSDDGIDSDSDIGMADGDQDLIADGGSGDSSKPQGFIETDSGEKVIRADYTACLNLPAVGKRAYGKCDDNSVVVIVNDGEAQEITCCPLSGKNILSAKDADKHIERVGTCQANEVLTGMLNAKTSAGFCSKINSKYLKLSTPVPSQYVNGNAPGIIGQIAKSYNVNDTCICPEGTVMIGGHSPQDNRCNEQCVKIEEKK